jgi:N-methylhydantoinase B
MFANMASHSIEVTEAEEPIQLLAYEFVADKAAPGKYRGAYVPALTFPREEGTLQMPTAATIARSVSMAAARAARRRTI